MKISILIASRAKDNPAMAFHRLLESLLETASSADNFEILVKLDDDDKDHPLAVGGIERPVSVKRIITPRAGGYADLHKAYLDLISLASSQSELFWVLSDDAVMGTKGWDGKLIEIASSKRGYPFVINTVCDIDMKTVSSGSCISHVDTYPVWNRTWIAIAGMGYAFNTDGWTGILCYNLENSFGIEKSAYRTFAALDLKRGDDGDGIQHAITDERWNGVRKWQIRRMESLMASDNMRQLSWLRAGALAHIIKGIK